LTIALSFAVACGTTDGAPKSDSSAVRAPAAQAATRRARVYPGALTKPIDSYSGDELYELVRRLEYGGSHERARTCRNAPGCDGPRASHRTRVEVSAVATQDSLGVSDLAAFGVVHARALNRGDAEEARYHMRAGNALEYYVIAQRDSAGGMRWRLEELETSTPRRHHQVATGHVQGCGHAWKAGARADFRSCARPEGGDTAPPLASARAWTLDDPIWVFCDEGCCTLVQ
jgi:hypothetical protein